MAMIHGRQRKKAIILKKNNLKQWQLARLLEISEATLVRKLRFELSAEEKGNVKKGKNWKT